MIRGSRFKRRKNSDESDNARIKSKHIIRDGIEMKSILEGNVYDYLKKNGITALYESESFLLWEGGKTHTPFYNAKRGHLKCFKSNLADITYTPDFIFEYNGIKVFVEAKGFENDSFPIRKKLFRKYLDENYKHGEAFYFEIHSVLQAKDMMEILEHGEIINKKKRKNK